MRRIRGAFVTAFWPFVRLKPRMIGNQDRTDAINALRAPTYVRLNAESIGLGRLLMDEARRVCELKLESIRALEKKALGQVTAAGTILAILAVFERSLPFGYKAIPIVMLAVAVSAYLGAAYVREGKLPSIGVYLSRDVVSEPWNEARIAVRQAGAWKDYGLELEAANEAKARYVRTGNVWLIGALVAIVAAVFLPAWSKSSTCAGASQASSPSTRSQTDVRRREGAASTRGKRAHGLNAAPGLGSGGWPR